MKKILAAILATFLLSSCVQNQIGKTNAVNEEITANDFVRGSEDIPLVDGLELIDNENVDFDSESGSIANVDYKSHIDLEAIQSFYIRTLPQMGWKLIKNDQDHSLFTRDGEKLEIQFVLSDNDDDADVIKFFLSSITLK